MYNFYSLILELMDVLKANFNTLSTRWNTMSEYINLISILLKKMDTIKSSNDTSDRVSSILDKLADSIIELAHLAKDEIQSVAAREGLENSMSIPSSHRESVSNVTFDDDIDDFILFCPTLLFFVSY